MRASSPVLYIAVIVQSTAFVAAQVLVSSQDALNKGRLDLYISRASPSSQAPDLVTRQSMVRVANQRSREYLVPKISYSPPMAPTTPRPDRTPSKARWLRSASTRHGCKAHGLWMSRV